MKYIQLILLSFSFLFFSPLKAETPLKTRIEKVKIYISGAQVSRTGETFLNPGEQTLKMSGLSPFLDESSLKVSAKGQFTVLSITHSLNYLKPIEQSERRLALQSKIDSLNDVVASLNGELEIIQEKKKVLDTNRNLGKDEGVSIAQLKEALSFYEEELGKMKRKELRVKNELKELEKLKKKFQNQLNTNRVEEKATSEVFILVKVDKRTKASFGISYLVSNAGWLPKYDMKVSDLAKPATLTYKASFFQNTQEDWNKVKLSFSSLDPKEGAQKPIMYPWYLSFGSKKRSSQILPNGLEYGGTAYGQVLDKETGEPLHGATVVVRGTTLGVYTDNDGRFTLNVPANASSLTISFIGYETKEIPPSQNISVSLLPASTHLDEVVVSGLDIRKRRAKARVRLEEKEDEASTILPSTTTQKATSVEFDVSLPYTLTSGSGAKVVDLEEYEIPASYQYYAVPKLNPSAFLVAQITDWASYNLLDGEINLFFEDTYVGKSLLNTSVLSDTMEVSLGKDNQIAITREKSKQFSKTRILGANRTDKKGFEISLKNNKQVPVTITLQDQIPISSNSSIEVKVLDTGKGSYHEETGIIDWELRLKPGEDKKLTFFYEVKYPKNRRVVLE